MPPSSSCRRCRILLPKPHPSPHSSSPPPSMQASQSPTPIITMGCACSKPQVTPEERATRDEEARLCPAPAVILMLNLFVGGTLDSRGVRAISEGVKRSSRWVCDFRHGTEGHHDSAAPTYLGTHAATSGSINANRGVLSTASAGVHVRPSVHPHASGSSE